LNPINISTLDGFSRWAPATWLRVRGSDAASFLQGQFTNDLRGLAVGGSAYGLWLTVKGKVLADSFVLRGEGSDEFRVGSYFSAAAVIRERLESFVIADDVTIDDETPQWSGFSLLLRQDRGDAKAAGSATFLQSLMQVAEGLGGFAFPGRRGSECVEFMVPVSSAANLDTLLREMREFSASEMEQRRIVAGVPAVPVDIGPADLPNEGGLDSVAISYTKGCYLGQEVMARLKSMGQVRRRLMRVRAEAGDVPALPAPLFAGERRVGELRSAVVDADGALVGLAMISLLNVEPGAKLAIGPAAAPGFELLDAR
jgi:folate-binding protein YgfZ